MPTPQCAHHWIIETAAGSVSKGKCQLCGEEREFSNSLQFMATNWQHRAQQSPAAPQPEEAEAAE